MGGKKFTVNVIRETVYGLLFSVSLTKIKKNGKRERGGYAPTWGRGGGVKIIKIIINNYVQMLL